MSKGLPSREQAIQILKENNCPPQVISHCIAVTDLALEMAAQLQKNGYKIDYQLVEAGALLHDLGRSKTHTVDHSLVGAQMAQSLGLPEAVVSIIKRHVGAGISVEEAKWLGWPDGVYEPQTLEEKVVCYADKLIDHSKRTPVKVEIHRLQNDNKVEAAQRVMRLHMEMSNMLGKTP